VSRQRWVSMSDFQCCICGRGIDDSDHAAVVVSVANLWNREEAGSQDLFAHSACAMAKLAGIFSPEVPFDVAALID
jgi:hypothetical protein